MKHRWALISVTYNSASQLVSSWRGVTIPPEVEWVVVDNASRDDTVEVASALGARVIPMETNEGFAAANNIGFHATASDFVMFINPDVTPEIGTLGRLEGTLAERKALVAPQLSNKDGSMQPNGRGWPTLPNKVKHRIRPDKTIGSYRLIASPGEVRNVAWITGAVIAGRRFDLESLGGWDERYFLYYEDSDLCLRARKAGFECLVDGAVVWTHQWARATAGLDFRAWQHELASMTRFYWTYPGLLLPTRLGYRVR